MCKKMGYDSRFCAEWIPLRFDPPLIRSYRYGNSNTRANAIRENLKLRLILDVCITNGRGGGNEDAEVKFSPQSAASRQANSFSVEFHICLKSKCQDRDIVLQQLHFAKSPEVTG